MEGRNDIPWNTFDNHQAYPAAHIAPSPMPPPPRPPPILLQMPPPMPHVDMQHVEIHILLDENRRLVEDRTSLQHELGAAREELRHMKAQHEIECMKLMGRGLELINELAATIPLQNEINHLRNEVTRLFTIKQDLSSQVETLTEDLARLQVENEQILSLRAEIDGLHRQLLCARTAAEYENKAKMELMDQIQTIKKGLEKASTIQQRDIDPFCRGLDVIQRLQSVSEKIAVFCSEIIQQLNYGLVRCQVLFLVPTHERAQQIENLMRALGSHLGVKIHASVGATSVEEDKHIILAGVHLIVGTPGRVLDMLRRRKPALRPNHIRMFVLDEANEMLSMAFDEQIYDILQFLPAKVQVVPIYDTMPADVLEITRKFMNKPVKILVKFDEPTLEY
ncbi:eukaryotic initiation factor 4A-11-like [Lycium ferocissimum]|uniref:eukaryotic initiation factor 4A-11-like n=1 Tax=Lycium ferocissimum TaxID=112874 RepID=UPI002814DAEC|nr:eukaryotic initiation factor 4A-11-like [Lycium ferocissimum]